MLRFEDETFAPFLTLGDFGKADTPDLPRSTRSGFFDSTGVGSALLRRTFVRRGPVYRPRSRAPSLVPHNLRSVLQRAGSGASPPMARKGTNATLRMLYGYRWRLSTSNIKRRVASHPSSGEWGGGGLSYFSVVYVPFLEFLRSRFSTSRSHHLRLEGHQQDRKKKSVYGGSHDAVARQINISAYSRFQEVVHVWTTYQRVYESSETIG